MKRSIQTQPRFSHFPGDAAGRRRRGMPNCNDGIGQNDPQGQSLAAGIYYSILFMMSMPYVILGTFGCVFYFHIRRARLANASGQSNAEADGEVAAPSK